MSVKCEICGKEFKTTQGLRGHKTFFHQLPSSSSKSAAPLTTQQQLIKLKNRLDKLEGIIGPREPSELEQLLGITDRPITEQLGQHTHQLAELSEQLNNIPQQVKPASNINTDVSNISRQVAQLNELVKRHDRWLTPNQITLLLTEGSQDCPAFLIDLNHLKKQVNNHQGAISWVRKKFNLAEKG